jgi:pyruvate formate lyase activating enzyme
MKGCPLKCAWCANPEAMERLPDVLYHKDRCNKCYKCVNVCEHGAISVSREGEFITIDRTICNRCEERICMSACDEGALQLVGQSITIDRLMEEIQKDSLFYRNSNGGITLSGGEPTSQPEFTLRLSKECKERGIHTILDTCGYTSWESMKEILDYIDLILYDIKHMDAKRHREFTGVSNKLILRNAKAIFAKNKVPAIIRIPIIPGYNDSKVNINTTAIFVRQIGGVQVNILPYHRLGMGKYEKLGRDYHFGKGIQPPSSSYLNEIKAIFESQSLNCLVV